MLRSPDKSLLHLKLFICVLLLTVLMLIVDILSRFDGYPGTYYAAVNQVGNFLIFLLSPVLPLLWLYYVHSQIEDAAGNIRRWLRLAPVLSAVNAAMLVLSQFYGWFYTISADNIYRRGPLYWFPVFITFAITAAAFVLIITNRKSIERKHFISLILFPAAPLICIVLQIIYYGTSLILNGAAVSILIAFLTIQNKRMNTDDLTGLYNRKGLEACIRHKISSSAKRRTFSAILLDLDRFKTINDTFGHQTGDHVLTVVSGLLKSCLRSDDFIARYGGDEFYIILDITDPDELAAVACRLRNCINEYNDRSTEPFKISFSMGFAVYDVHSRMSPQEFHMHLDSLMYADKRAGSGYQHKN